ncbi:MAG: dihydropteroate synthase [Lentisphaeraceae bacterium]|nr:dihydropteroate synthase [Lentisphaeraceae bacterium]
MAVLNCTPDSFSDGGENLAVEKAVANALVMIEQGAGLIDIGGESTRPGALPVDEQEELRRVVPVIKALRQKSSIPISIDTTKATVAREALAAGADIINDISAFNRDPEMKQVALETGAGCMLMHMRGTPQTMQQFLEYNDVVSDVKAELNETIQKLLDFGIQRQAIMVDPGIGFSKNVEQNLELIQRLDEFLDMGFPILLGTSRKSFIGKVLQKTEPQERVWGTAASIAIGICKGASVVRVHDIAEMKDVVDVCDAILN